MAVVRTSTAAVAAVARVRPVAADEAAAVADGAVAAAGEAVEAAAEN